MGISKCITECGQRAKYRKEPLVNLISNPTSKEKNEIIKKRLAQAKKQLQDSIIEGNPAKIKRSKEILENMKEAVARQQSRM